uniref:Pygopus family PHD finger 1 n=1 Tax=Leptobrachium leishanense TaxID=445787 RepID=A0A8C5M7Y2_9ANUR
PSGALRYSPFLKVWSLGSDAFPRPRDRITANKSPINEYAPPRVTSSDHLIASNPFADDYMVSYPLAYSQIYKQRPCSRGQNSYRVLHNTHPRMVSPVPVSPSREQLLHFQRMTMHRALGRAHYFNVIAQDNHNHLCFGAGLDPNITFPGQHFRSVQPQCVQTSESPNHFNLRTNHRSLKNNFTVHMEAINPSAQPQNHYAIPRPFSSNLSHQNQVSDFTILSDDTDDLRSVSVEPQPVDDTKRKPETHCSPELAKTDVTSQEKCNRWLLHAVSCGHLTKRPLYPCGICSGEVDDVKDAIMCEASCRQWFHRTCTGLTEVAHMLLTSEASAVWGCDGCMNKKDIKLVQIKP